MHVRACRKGAQLEWCSIGKGAHGWEVLCRVLLQAVAQVLVKGLDVLQVDAQPAAILVQSVAAAQGGNGSAAGFIEPLLVPRPYC